MALIKCKECGNQVSTKAEACPNCGAKIARTRPAFKFVGVLLLALFGWAILSQSHTDSATAQDAQQDAAPLFTTTAQEIAHDYDANTVSADNRYKGQRFKITGIISDIATDITGSAIIRMVGGVNQFMEPQAELVDHEKQKSAALSKGQQISLVCTGNGDIAKTPMMNDCVIK